MASPNIEKVIKLMVTEGLNQGEAASAVKITPQYFSAWKNSNKQEYQDIKLKYERESLGELPSLAIKTYKDILTSGRSEHVRYLVASDILDRTGHKPSEKSEVELSGGIMFIEDVPADD